LTKEKEGMAIKKPPRKRRTIKKKPEFKRQEIWRYKRVKSSWRRPNGVDSKMRKRVKGWPKPVDTGYRGPREARELHPSGYEEVLVRNVDDVYTVDPETQAMRIAHSTGMRKRVEISSRAREKGIHILNPVAERELREEEKEEAEESGEGEKSRES